MDVRKTGLRWMLRQRTSHTHEKLDRKVSQLDMATEEGLSAFLMGNALAHRALLGCDAAFQGHIARRHALLCEDLVSLGQAAPSVVRDAPRLGHGTAPGYRYVYAGSAMGGRVLAKRHGAADSARVRAAGRFLNDPDLTEFWKDVQAELATLPETGALAEAALDGAEACFALFDRAFEIALADMRVPAHG